MCACSACSDSVHLASLAPTEPKSKDKRETTNTRVARTSLIAGRDRPLAPLTETNWKKSVNDSRTDGSTFQFQSSYLVELLPLDMTPINR